MQYEQRIFTRDKVAYDKAEILFISCEIRFEKGLKGNKCSPKASKKVTLGVQCYETLRNCP